MSRTKIQSKKSNAQVNAKSILQEAQELVGVDRAKDWGGVTPSFTRIANLWSAYKEDTKFTAMDVAMMLVLLKVSRSKTSPKRDTFVDIAGYSECAAQIADHNADKELEQLIHKICR